MFTSLLLTFFRLESWERHNSGHACGLVFQKTVHIIGGARSQALQRDRDSRRAAFLSTGWKTEAVRAISLQHLGFWLFRSLFHGKTPHISSFVYIQLRTVGKTMTRSVNCTSCEQNMHEGVGRGGGNTRFLVDANTTRKLVQKQNM